MKQKFEIDTTKGVTPNELMGCLEDTLGRDEIIDVIELNKSIDPKHCDIFIENVNITLLKLQAPSVLACVDDTKDPKEKELLNGVWELIQNMLDGVQEIEYEIEQSKKIKGE